jgi:hypothetical protein
VSARDAPGIILILIKKKRREFMKKNFLSLLTVLSVALAVLLVAGEANAQPRKARGKVYTKAEVGAIIKRVEERMDNFIDNFDDALDSSPLNGTDREDYLMARTRDLESCADKLRNEFDKNDLWIENKDRVRQCLNHASTIDVAMRNQRLGAKTESNWAKVRYELNTLAKVYNLPVVGSKAYN